MINFLKARLFAALFSALLLGSFFVTAWYKYRTYGRVFTYSIDFTGGTQVLLKAEKTISTSDVKNILLDQWSGADVRSFSETEIMVRVKEVSTTADVDRQIHAYLEQRMPEYHFTILQSDSVGAGVGQMLRWKSARAVLFAIIAMLLYIALRFWSFAFALGAVVALFHDAFAILACFLFLDREISINVIGAILAILGYSINDTIIIFTQIRNQLAKMGHASLTDVVNTSLNVTLRRTILTSVSTALPVIAMILFGGEALFDFSLALLIGLIFGTYSSIYIASPIMMLCYRKK
ncbi:MAG TPA: protein translocase subunit SecF [Candidatus Bathyarchaeia archaeon]|nr:protein translocase subunit SecF [Candidatus Bathyarchaeia archaeon]